MIKKAIISGKEVTFDMEKVAHSGSTARIFVSNCGSFIMKVVGAPQRYCEADCYSREVFLLKHLKSHGFDWVPDILSTCDEDKSIVIYDCSQSYN